MPDDLLADVEALIRGLGRCGFSDPARRLQELVHGTAWTTSSEMIGEIGLAVLSIQAAVSRELPRSVAADLRRVMAGVREVWPDIGPADGGGQQ